MSFNASNEINAMQELMFNTLSSFAQLERFLIIERTAEERE